MAAAWAETRGGFTDKHLNLTKESRNASCGRGKVKNPNGASRNYSWQKHKYVLMKDPNAEKTVVNSRNDAKLLFISWTTWERRVLWGRDIGSSCLIGSHPNLCSAKCVLQVFRLHVLYIKSFSAFVILWLFLCSEQLVSTTCFHGSVELARVRCGQVNQV